MVGRKLHMFDNHLLLEWTIYLMQFYQGTIGFLKGKQQSPELNIIQIFSYFV